ncbi:hypothetical protein HDU93_006482, partial [Gonapodya sp. JEL0774]
GKLHTNVDAISRVLPDDDREPMDLDTSVPTYGDVSRPELPDEAVGRKSETRFVLRPSGVRTFAGVDESDAEMAEGDAVPEAGAPGAFSAHSFAEARYRESWAKAQYADYDLHSVINVLQNRVPEGEADSRQYVEAARRLNAILWGKTLT